MALYENETLEYKRQYTPDIKKEVVAFANTAGGTIYIGMDDDGRPVGVQDPEGRWFESSRSHQSRRK